MLRKENTANLSTETGALISDHTRCTNAPAYTKINFAKINTAHRVLGPHTEVSNVARQCKRVSFCIRISRSLCTFSQLFLGRRQKSVSCGRAVLKVIIPEKFARTAIRPCGRLALWEREDCGS